VAGLAESKGLISATSIKDPTDPIWSNDQDVKEFQSFIRKYYPEGANDNGTVASAYSIAATMAQVLRQSGDDLTRENVMAQAANLSDYAAPLLLPGIKINTSKTNYFPIEQMQMNKFDGTSWIRFGDLVPAQ
jgi:branched-chain amino acid transport system substrate-binding protein